LLLYKPFEQDDMKLCKQEGFLEWLTAFPFMISCFPDFLSKDPKEASRLFSGSRRPPGDPRLHPRREQTSRGAGCPKAEARLGLKLKEITTINRIRGCKKKPPQDVRRLSRDRHQPAVRSKA
jgi:hypothetical protein